MLPFRPGASWGEDIVRLGLGCEEEGLDDLAERGQFISGVPFSATPDSPADPVIHKESKDISRVVGAHPKRGIAKASCFLDRGRPTGLIESLQDCATMTEADPSIEGPVNARKARLTLVRVNGEKPQNLSAFLSQPVDSASPSPGVEASK